MSFKLAPVKIDVFLPASGAIRNSRNDLHNELIKTLHKKKAHNKSAHQGGKSGPLYINQKSSPTEVTGWLNAKGFSTRSV